MQHQLVRRTRLHDPENDGAQRRQAWTKRAQRLYTETEEARWLQAETEGGRRLQTKTEGALRHLPGTEESWRLNARRMEIGSSRLTRRELSGFRLRSMMQL